MMALSVLLVIADDDDDSSPVMFGGGIRLVVALLPHCLRKSFIESL
jgi:hypothetical protein